MYTLAVQSEAWIPIMVMVIAHAVGGLLFVPGIKLFYRARASLRWGTVEGRIVESRLGQRRTKSGVRSTARVTYEYAVGGQTYRSDTLAFSRPLSKMMMTPKEILQLYPEAKMVTVYHHPRKPGVSVLEPGGWSFLGVFLVAWGLVFLGAGISIMVEMIRLLT